MSKFFVWMVSSLLIVSCVCVSQEARAENANSFDDIGVVEYIVKSDWLNYNDAYGYVISCTRRQFPPERLRGFVQRLQYLCPEESKANLLLSGLVCLEEGKINEAIGDLRKSVAVKDGRPVRLHHTALQYLGIALVMEQRDEDLRSLSGELEDIWDKDTNGVFTLMYCASKIEDADKRRDYVQRLFQGLSPELLKSVVAKASQNPSIMGVFDEGLSKSGISFNKIIEDYKENLRKERFPVGFDSKALDSLGSKLMADIIKRFYENPLMTVDVANYYELFKDIDNPQSARKCILYTELLQYLFPENGGIQYMLGVAYMKGNKMDFAAHAFMRAYELDRGAIGMALLAVHGVNYTFSLDRGRIERELYERTKVVAIYNPSAMGQLLSYLSLGNKSFKCDTDDQLLQMLFAKYQAHPDFGPRIQKLMVNGIP